MTRAHYYHWHGFSRLLHVENSFRFFFKCLHVRLLHSRAGILLLRCAPLNAIFPPNCVTFPMHSRPASPDFASPGAMSPPNHFHFMHMLQIHFCRIRGVFTDELAEPLFKFTCFVLVLKLHTHHITVIRARISFAPIWRSFSIVMNALSYRTCLRGGHLA
jgi:hypothetical protein